MIISMLWCKMFFSSQVGVIEASNVTECPNGRPKVLRQKSQMSTEVAQNVGQFLGGFEVVCSILGCSVSFDDWSPKERVKSYKKQHSSVWPNSSGWWRTGWRVWGHRGNPHEAQWFWSLVSKEKSEKLWERHLQPNSTAWKSSGSLFKPYESNTQSEVLKPLRTKGHLPDPVAQRESWLLRSSQVVGSIQRIEYEIRLTVPISVWQG